MLAYILSTYVLFDLEENKKEKYEKTKSSF